MQKIKYITNKELLAEIKKCKETFCSFSAPEYASYDAIVTDVRLITADLLAEVLEQKAQRLAATDGAAEIDPSSIVFRVMTDSHLPRMDDKRRRLTDDGELVKTNFTPFRHYILAGNEAVEVGRSHWKGDFTNGRFCVSHGRINDRLARMFVLLVERYSLGGSWRGYCVDDTTEALTQRGWLDMDEITTNDVILSYNQDRLAWSKIKSIFRDENYDGPMFKMTAKGLDAFVTPGHKFVTTAGIKPVEQLVDDDKIILSGGAVEDGPGGYTDAFVKTVGWYVGQTDEAAPGSMRRELGNLMDRVAPNRVMPISFILALPQSQRELLIESLLNGDGWWRYNERGNYCHPDKENVDAFVILCALAGLRTKVVEKDVDATKVYVAHLLIEPDEVSLRNVNFHGGKQKGQPNVATHEYQGRVWCPETEYGSFMVRRNGCVYLTGNSYVDEMRSHATEQLARVGLQFDESRSDNPFAFYTQIIKNCFRRTLIIERRNQDLRDDLLLMSGAQPSYTRQLDNEFDQRGDDAVEKPAKRGRKPKQASNSR